MRLSLSGMVGKTATLLSTEGKKIMKYLGFRIDAPGVRVFLSDLAVLLAVPVVEWTR